MQNVENHGFTGFFRWITVDNHVDNGDKRGKTPVYIQMILICLCMKMGARIDIFYKNIEGVLVWKQFICYTNTKYNGKLAFVQLAIADGGSREDTHGG